MAIIRFVFGTVISLVALAIAVKLVAIILAVVGIALKLVWLAVIVGLILLAGWIVYKICVPQPAAQS